MPSWKQILLIQSRSIQFRYTHACEILPQTDEVGLIVFYKGRLRSFDKARWTAIACSVIGNDHNIRYDWEEQSVEYS